MTAPRYRIKVRDPALIMTAATFARSCASAGALGMHPGDHVRQVFGTTVLWAYRLRCGGVEVRDVASGGAA